MGRFHEFYFTSRDNLLQCNRNIISQVFRFLALMYGQKPHMIRVYIMIKMRDGKGWCELNIENTLYVALKDRTWW